MLKSTIKLVEKEPMEELIASEILVEDIENEEEVLNANEITQRVHRGTSPRDDKQSVG